MPREALRGDPADVRDVEPEQHARERRPLRALDRLNCLGRADLREAVELEQLLLRQPVEVRQRADEPELPEPPHQLLADAFDVGRALDPVDQGLEPARGTRAVRAAVHRLALGLDDVCPAKRALLRHLERLRAGLVLAGGTDDLRDHVAGALDDHAVALADVLAVDVVLVVERRPRDGDAADLHGLEHRPGVERARAADADRDLVQRRLGGHRRPLERARPARPRVERAEHRLLLERVDLDHDPVDLVVELRAPALPVGTALRHLLDRLEPLGERVRPEAVLAQPLELVPVRGELHALACTHAVDPHRERPRRR